MENVFSGYRMNSIWKQYRKLLTNPYHFHAVNILFLDSGCDMEFMWGTWGVVCWVPSLNSVFWRCITGARWALPAGFILQKIRHVIFSETFTLGEKANSNLNVCQQVVMMTHDLLFRMWPEHKTEESSVDVLVGDALLQLPGIIILSDPSGYPVAWGFLSFWWTPCLHPEQRSQLSW